MKFITVDTYEKLSRQAANITLLIFTSRRERLWCFYENINRNRILGKFSRRRKSN